MRSRFLPEAVLFLLLAIVLAAATNALAGSQRKLKWVGSYDLPAERLAAAGVAATPSGAAPASAASGTSAASKSFPPHPDKASADISGEDVMELHARKTVPFLDARRTSVYRDGHIAGARPFSVWESDVDEKVKAYFAEGTDQSAPIVVYCSGGTCEDSHMLAEKLYLVGFDNVLIYKDGYPDWIQRGLPVTKGSEP